MDITRIPDYNTPKIGDNKKEQPVDIKVKLTKDMYEFIGNYIKKNNPTMGADLAKIYEEAAKKAADGNGEIQKKLEALEKVLKPLKNPQSIELPKEITDEIAKLIEEVKEFQVENKTIDPFSKMLPRNEEKAKEEQIIQNLKKLGVDVDVVRYNSSNGSVDIYPSDDGSANRLRILFQKNNLSGLQTKAPNANLVFMTHIDQLDKLMDKVETGELVRGEWMSKPDPLEGLRSFDIQEMLRPRPSELPL